MKKIAVFGSINIDYFVETERIPQAGETITGKNFFINIGGKGANQAVAAARLGGDVTLFGSIGNDEQKSMLVNHFKAEKVNVDYLNIRQDSATGAAFIQLYEGDNRIIIIPGANQCSNQEYAARILEQLITYDIFIFQLEIPLETMLYLIPILHQHNKIIIMDPAPAQVLPKDIAAMITYLTPNEHEVAIITDQERDTELLLEENPNKLIVTLGKKGVKYHDGQKVVTIPSRLVPTVDTTGAGDTFTGAFAVALAEGKRLEECIQYGMIAASASVTKKGAQAGMPTKEEMTMLLAEVKEP